jgi:hypothetical protein
MSELYIPKLSQFINLARNNALARSNRFLVEFFPPSSSTPNLDNVIGMMCEEAEFPGKSIETRSLRIAALTEQRAHYVDYKNKQITFKFIVDNSWQVKNYFDDWMALAIDPMYEDADTPKEIGFYSNYIGDVNIFSLAPIFNAKYEQTGTKKGHYSDPENNTEAPLYGVRLREAWPTELHSQPMASGAEGYHRLSVTLTFKWWEDILVGGAGDSGAKPLVQKKPQNISGVTQEEAILRLSEPKKIPPVLLKSCKLPPKAPTFWERFGGGGGFSGGDNSGSW